MIWELVKNLEDSISDDSKELGQAKATMLVNFGPDGRCHSGLVKPEQTLTQMILSAFEYYEKHNKAMHTDGEKCPNCIDGHYYKIIDYCKCGYERRR